MTHSISIPSKRQTSSLSIQSSEAASSESSVTSPLQCSPIQGVMSKIKSSFGGFFCSPQTHFSFLTGDVTKDLGMLLSFPEKQRQGYLQVLNKEIAGHSEHVLIKLSALQALNLLKAYVKMILSDSKYALNFDELLDCGFPVFESLDRIGHKECCIDEVIWSGNVQAALSLIKRGYGLGYYLSRDSMNQASPQEVKMGSRFGRFSDNSDDCLGVRSGSGLAHLLLLNATREQIYDVILNSRLSFATPASEVAQPIVYAAARGDQGLVSDMLENVPEVRAALDSHRTSINSLKKMKNSSKEVSAIACSILKKISPGDAWHA